MPKLESEHALPKYIEDALKQIAVDEGLGEVNIEVSPGSNHGDGFLAVMLRVRLIGRDSTLSLICKTAPECRLRREQFNTIYVFGREVFMYTKVLPAFLEFQRARGLTPADGFYNIPKVYTAIYDVDQDHFLIVMEDLLQSGYSMWDRFKPVDFDHAALTMQHLGRFHGVSFAMRNQQPEIFQEFRGLTDIFKDRFQNEKDTFLNMFHMSFERAIECLLPEDRVEFEKMTALKGTFIQEMRECIGPVEPFSVVNHGDCWGNNLMFTHSEVGMERVVESVLIRRSFQDNGRPKKVCFIDWQASRFSSPVLDICFYVFSTTEQGLRQRHYEELLDIYYQSLEVTVRKLGSDPERLFPLEEFRKQLKTLSRYGVIMAPVLLQIITANPIDIPDLDAASKDLSEKGAEEMGLFITDRNVSVYEERIRGVIRDAVKLQYI